MESQAIVLIVAFFYFIPWIVALRNGHRHAAGIFILNLFAFTGVAWVGALIWAVLPPEKKQSDAEKMLELMQEMDELRNKDANTEVAK